MQQTERDEQDSLPESNLATQLEEGATQVQLESKPLLCSLQSYLGCTYRLPSISLAFSSIKKAPLPSTQHLADCHSFAASLLQEVFQKELPGSVVGQPSAIADELAAVHSQKVALVLVRKTRSIPFTT